MVDVSLEHHETQFTVESRLLEELGERLVSNAEVALLELIKNAYDADATTCTVSCDDDSITIMDDGHGMTQEEFINRWMTVATSSKLSEEVSREFHRKVTGSKGVGRFAARFLGSCLTLRTVAYDPIVKCQTVIAVTFDWSAFDGSASLEDLKIPYTRTHPVDELCGTTLVVSGLSGLVDDNTLYGVKSKILHITSPFRALDAGPMAKGFSSRKAGRRSDPGFRVLVGSDESEGDEDLAANVLRNYVGRVRVALSGDDLKVDVWFAGKEKPVVSEHFAFDNVIGTPVHADIRYFPKRAGTFSRKGIDGNQAWRWVRQNSGVAIVDHGFRVLPYGLENDDWLLLDADTSHNRRDWRSDTMARYYPIPQNIRKQPKLNPMLALPSNHQIVGAIFLDSAPTRDLDAGGLVPSMDRQGYLENEGFLDLWEAIRLSIELLAHCDRQEQLEKERLKAEAAKKEVRADIKAAIAQIESSPTLTSADKGRLIVEYTTLYDSVEELDEYNRRQRQNLEVMGLLGVVAGFMTHEYQGILFNLRRLIDNVAPLVKKHTAILSVVAELKESEDRFSEYASYTKLFFGRAVQLPESPYKAKPQIDRVVRTFGRYARERNVEITVQVDARLVAPHVPVAMYSGVVLNLYSNALKALLQLKKRATKRLAVKAWNDDRAHHIEVMDTGVGIPLGVRKRIWDPFYTTTSSMNNPLGSGMGLGLSLVRRILENVGGRIDLVDPPQGYETCFHVTIPR